MNENVSMRASIFVQDKNGSSYADNNDSNACQQQSPQAHIRPVIGRNCNARVLNAQIVADLAGDVECLNLAEPGPTQTSISC